MSKLSFRARALDTGKPMPVLRSADVPDLPDFAAINRAVPQMPTGMEKEEEAEHHLQRAISAQQAFGRAVEHVIPTPEVFPVNDQIIDELYPPTCKMSHQLIHVQLPSFEQEQPEYDMDSEDEEWFGRMKQHLNITETKFEEMIECLEKSCLDRKVIELAEAQALLKGFDEGILISVYDYWISKKIRLRSKSLLPQIKTEKRDGSSGNNPYIAFRRRTEKMQTRKNRKNDESSYEKMLKLKRDFTTVSDMMQLIKSREMLKVNLLKYTFEIYDKRYQIGDFNGQIYNDLMATRPSNQPVRDKIPKIVKNDDNVQARRKRTYKKVPKSDAATAHKSHSGSGGFMSEEEISPGQGVSSQGSERTDEDDNPDGAFAFKRKMGCCYQAPLERLSGWPWDAPDEGGLGRPQYRFNLTSLSRPPLCIGFARRRIGRGGRIIFDRVNSNFERWSNVDSDERRMHFRPSSPILEDLSVQTFDFNSVNFCEEDINFSNITDNPFRRLNDKFIYENNQYKEHERMLTNYANSVVCNPQHSCDNLNLSTPKSTLALAHSSMPTASSLSTSTSSTSSSQGITRPQEKPPLQKKLQNNLQYLSPNRPHYEAVLADLNDNITQQDKLNSNFPNLLMSDNAALGDIIGSIELPYLNSNNEESNDHSILGSGSSLKGFGVKAS